MWFLVRIIIAGIAFCFKFFGRYTTEFFKGNPVYVDDLPCHIYQSRHKGSVRYTLFTVSLPLNHIFGFHPENSLDGFFKNLGLATEIQTGDQKFDQFVYVVSDSRSFNQKIIGDPRLRELIFQALNFTNCEFIRGNGNVIQLKVSGQCFQESDIAKVLVAIRNILKPLGNQSAAFFDDPFVKKTLFIEGIIWSIAGYSAGAFMDYYVRTGDLYLHSGRLLSQGIVCGLFVAAALVFGTFILMRGSSRGHKIILESGIVLAVSLPIIGVQGLSDVNIEMDKTPPTTVEMQVFRKKERKIRRRRSPDKIEYTLLLKPQENAFGQPVVPDRLEVDSDVFRKATIGKSVRIVIGQGYLGHAYYRSFEFPES